jgi:hypothetical protein
MLLFGRVEKHAFWVPDTIGRVLNNTYLVEVSSEDYALTIKAPKFGLDSVLARSIAPLENTSVVYCAGRLRTPIQASDHFSLHSLLHAGASIRRIWPAPEPQGDRRCDPPSPGRSS